MNNMKNAAVLISLEHYSPFVHLDLVMVNIFFKISSKYRAKNS